MQRPVAQGFLGPGSLNLSHWMAKRNRRTLGGEQEDDEEEIESISHEKIFNRQRFQVYQTTDIFGPLGVTCG